MKLFKSKSLNNFFYNNKNNNSIINNNNNKFKNCFCCKYKTINEEKYQIKFYKNESHLILYKKINNKINNILKTNKIFNRINSNNENVLNLRKTLPKSLSFSFKDNKINLLLKNNNNNLNNCFNIKKLKIFNKDNDIKLNNNNKKIKNINKIITKEKNKDYRKIYKSQENQNINLHSKIFANNFLNLIKTKTFYNSHINDTHMKKYKNINLSLLNKKIILVNIIKNFNNNIDYI